MGISSSRLVSPTWNGFFLSMEESTVSMCNLVSPLLFHSLGFALRLLSFLFVY